MTNHAGSARARLGWVEDWQSREGDSDATQIANVLAAQVHATLALADEQRTANLIALAVSGTEDSRTRLIPVVMTRLGLAPTTPNQEQNR